MTDEPDPAKVLAKLAAMSRARQNVFRVNEVWPESFFARIRECEQLADETMYPEMQAMMQKLVGLWRELARSLPANDGERAPANDC
jgi:hypothetical protein